MIDDQLVLRVERLRDEVESLKGNLRSRYSSKTRPVVSQELREHAAAIAERWLVEMTGRADVSGAIGGNTVAERSVQFQRLLTYSERATLRKKYDQTLNAILKDFRASVIVPLKAHRSNASGLSAAALPVVPTTHLLLKHASVAFVGQSFAANDEPVNRLIQRVISALGLTVLTGEKPRAGSVSMKVRDRIDRSEVFIGIFTRRDKIEGKTEWSTSSWVIDEKAYALARSKRLVLLREQGVVSIGGLQGDYEYLEFDRSDLANLLIRLVEIFSSNE
jgi:hypothetical protein